MMKICAKGDRREESRRSHCGGGGRGCRAGKCEEVCVGAVVEGGLMGAGMLAGGAEICVQWCSMQGGVDEIDEMDESDGDGLLG